MGQTRRPPGLLKRPASPPIGKGWGLVASEDPSLCERNAEKDGQPGGAQQGSPGVRGHPACDRGAVVSRILRAWGRGSRLRRPPEGSSLYAQSEAQCDFQDSDV